MNWWQRFWYGFTRYVPGLRNRSDWQGYKAIDDVKVDDSDDWRNRNNNHI